MVTPTNAAAPAISAVGTNPGASILNTLGAGSGINTATLVTQLAAAERASADAALQARTTRNSAQISALAQVKNGVDAFVMSMTGLSADAILGPQPTSSDTAVVSVGLDPTVHDAAPINASLAVDQLASSQTLVSGRFPSASTSVGQGTLTITLGMLANSADNATGFVPAQGAPIIVSIGPGNDSLSGLVAAINSSRAGVSASILNDGQGARLVLKGATGETNGFTLTAADASGNPDGTSLSAFAFGPGYSSVTTIASSAANAQFRIDGVAISRPTNVVSDVLTGYTLTLNAAQTGAAAIISSARDASLTQAAVKDYVAAYNTLISNLNAETVPGSNERTGAPSGPLYGQSTTAILKSQLAALTSHYGGGTTLAALGVSTGRDGALSVDSATLEAAVRADTGEIQRLFAGLPNADGTLSTDTGIGGAVKAMRDALTGTDGGFTIYSARLASDATTIGNDTAALDSRIASYTAALGTQFSAMNAAVAQYKSISSFLTQQIDAWNRTSSNGSVVTA